MEQDIVSIIIPCYGDYWFYLPEALNSLKTQTDKRFEVIIQHGNNVAECRNKGVEKAKGKWILLLDSDDKISEQYIKRIIECDADILMVDYQEFGLHEAMGRLCEEYTPEKAKDNDLMIISAAFKKELFVGFSDIEREDRDFWYRMLLNGAKVHKINELLFFYGKHGKSRSSELK